MNNYSKCGILALYFLMSNFCRILLPYEFLYGAVFISIITAKIYRNCGYFRVWENKIG